MAIGMIGKDPTIGDIVHCFNGPVDESINGKVIDDNGEQWWCKYEWLVIKE